MEFLRFGSSIPGTYWGCCAIDIIQNFNKDPDEKSSIQCVSGDSGMDLGGKFLGKTYREIFLSRLRIGTFGTDDMPNHAFIASLTGWQIRTENGAKWLAILKESGFEFIRAVQNSVYTGDEVANKLGDGWVASDTEWDEDEYCDDSTNNINYVFALFRNIGDGAIPDPFTPPSEWVSLPKVKAEQYDYFGFTSDDRLGNVSELTKNQFEADKKVWEDIGPAKFYTKEELKKDGVPIYLAGLRSTSPQELEENRLSHQKKET